MKRNKRSSRPGRRAPVSKIVAAGVRTYSDTGQTQAYVEYANGSSTVGSPDNTHMQQLLARAKREGVNVKLGQVF